MSGANGFDGAVLCGGRSRRMGTDKALLEVDGVPMARRVADALRAAGATTVVAVGGDAAGLRACGLSVRADRWPGEGPLGGVIQSLRTVGTRPSVVVLSCDLMEPDPDVIAGLVVRRAETGADLVVPVAGGRPQWTHGAWRRDVGGVLSDAFAAGERSLVGATADLHVARWVVTDPSVLADADRPADLASRRGHS